MREADVQRHIVKKIDLALRGRSWNWLAKKSGISQPTLNTQKNPSGTSPKITLTTLLAISPVLEKPLGYFFPEEILGGMTPEDPVALIAVERIGRIIDWSREAQEAQGIPMPEALERALDVYGRIVPRLDNARNSHPTHPANRKQKPRRKEE